MDSNKDYHLSACANEQKSEHAQLNLMKTFAMNLDFLDYRPSVNHVKTLKFLVSHGIKFLLFFVELNFHKKEVQWRGMFDVCRGCA